MSRIIKKQTETGLRFDLNLDLSPLKGRITPPNKRHSPPGYIAVDVHLASRLYDAEIPFTICGNNVNAFHVFGGWHLGYTPSIDAMREQSLEDLLNNWLFYLDSELGSYPVFYVKKSDLERLPKWEPENGEGE